MFYCGTIPIHPLSTSTKKFVIFFSPEKQSDCPYISVRAPSSSLFAASVHKIAAHLVFAVDKCQWHVTNKNELTYSFVYPKLNGNFHFIITILFDSSGVCRVDRTSFVFTCKSTSFSGMRRRDNSNAFLHQSAVYSQAHLIANEIRKCANGHNIERLVAAFHFLRLKLTHQFRDKNILLILCWKMCLATHWQVLSAEWDPQMRERFYYY